MKTELHLANRFLINLSCYFKKKFKEICRFGTILLTSDSLNSQISAGSSGLQHGKIEMGSRGDGVCITETVKCKFGDL